MSVIVAIKENGKIYIGADSQSTRGSCRASLSNPNNYKIWKVKGVDNCIMGHVGALKDACAIRVMNDLVRKIDEINGDIDFEYVVSRIELMIRDELITHKFISDDNAYEDMESRFIFCYKDKMYTISYGAVIEQDDFVAIGSGESSAIGSLVSTEGLPAKERIIKAIKASVTNDIYVDYPIILTDTEFAKFKIISEENESKYIKSHK